MPIPGGVPTTAWAADRTSGGSVASLARSGFGRSSAITVSLMAIGWEAPEEPAPRAVEPISVAGRRSSQEAASRPLVVRLRRESPVSVEPPFSDRPCLRRSERAPVCEAVRACFRFDGVGVPEAQVRGADALDLIGGFRGGRTPSPAGQPVTREREQR